MTQNINEPEILKAMFSIEGITFENNEGWNSLAEHVAVHNQYLNMMLKYNVSWDDALFSWYENVYTPLRREVMTARVRKAFPAKTSGELYLDISDHWFYLKEKDENISAAAAAYDFTQINKEKKNIFSKIFKSQPSTEIQYRRLTAA
ncbi:MAG TPA: hypothetical protein DCO79_07950 [Spirochaeta sp.]|nr:hypothetical protein [Spirochaeta sp.]